MRNTGVIRKKRKRNNVAPVALFCSMLLLVTSPLLVYGASGDISSEEILSEEILPEDVSPENISPEEELEAFDVIPLDEDNDDDEGDEGSGYDEDDDRDNNDINDKDDLKPTASLKLKGSIDSIRVLSTASEPSTGKVLKPIIPSRMTS